MNVEACMTRKPRCLTSRDTVITAKALMDAGGFHRMPVVDAGRMTGILTDRDIRKHWEALESISVAPQCPEILSASDRKILSKLLRA